MRVLSLGETESSGKVLGKVGYTGNSGDDGLVDRLLVGSLLGGELLLLLLSVLEELSLGSRSLGGLLLGEVGVVELGVELFARETKVGQSRLSVSRFVSSAQIVSLHHLCPAWTVIPDSSALARLHSRYSRVPVVASFETHLERGEVNLGRGGDNVGLVNATKGDTVDLEGTGHEEETRGELTENDNALASESTGEEDDDGSGDDGRTELGGLDRLARDLGLTDVVARVVRGLVGLLGSTLGGGSRFGLTLVKALLGVDLAARELADVGRDVGVAGHLWFVVGFEGRGKESKREIRGRVSEVRVCGWVV